MRQPCQVCGTETRSVCYKLYICAACTMFYRRNFRLQKELKCRRLNHCDLKIADRRICRACRLRECRALGLRMVGKSLVVQQNGVPVDDMPDEEGEEAGGRRVPLAGSASPPCAAAAADAPCTSAGAVDFGDELSKMSAALHQIQANFNSLRGLSAAPPPLRLEAAPLLAPLAPPQRRSPPPPPPPSVSVAEMAQTVRAIRLHARHTQRHAQVVPGPKSAPCADRPAHITASAYPAVEGQLMACAGFSAAEFLDQFADLTPDEKTLIIKACYTRLAFLHRLLTNNLHFPNRGDPNFFISTGYYANMREFNVVLSDLEAMVPAKQLVEFISRSRAFIAPYCEFTLSIVDAFRDLMPDAIESATLFTLCILDTMEELQVGVEQARVVQDRLSEELGTYLSKKWTVERVCQRTLHLSGLLDKNKRLASKYDELYAIMNTLLTENNQPFLRKPALGDDQLREIQVLVGGQSALFH